MVERLRTGIEAGDVRAVTDRGGPPGSNADAGRDLQARRKTGVAAIDAGGSGPDRAGR